MASGGINSVTLIEAPVIGLFSSLTADRRGKEQQGKSTDWCKKIGVSVER